MSTREGLPFHGGAVEAIAREYGHDADALLDFSANINPLGPPPEVLAALRDALGDPATLTRYPDAEQPALRAAFAYHTGTTPADIAIGNGTAALLDAAIRTFAPQRCVVPVPAFSEYAKALTQHGVELLPFPLAAGEDFALDPAALVHFAQRNRADLCIVNNPHNPSGAALDRAQIFALIERLAGRGCRTIVDEAFIDYIPSASVAQLAPQSGTAIVLRSLTKFYAMPGMRIGFAVAAPQLAVRIEALLPSWPVTTLAFVAARTALQANLYTERTIAANARERTALQNALQLLGLRVVPSAANFLLVDLTPYGANAADVRHRLIRNDGIVVRACDDYDCLKTTFIRVAVRNTPDNMRLIDALRRTLEHAGRGTAKRNV